MLSADHKFIFVHIPKTAGESISSALRKYSDATVEKTKIRHRRSLNVGHPELSLGKHATMEEYRTALGSEFSEYTTFTCIRNPWDRAISYYFYGQKDLMDEAYFDRDIFATHVRDIEPQTDYLKLDGVVSVDKILRYENLRSDFAALCSDLKLPKMSLPHMNQSIKREDYRSYYDDDTMRIVRGKYAEDIKTFQYKF